MNVLLHLSDIAIPLIFFLVIGFGCAGGVKVYENFLKGASDGLKLVLELVPTLIGLMTATSVLRASGFFDFLGNLLSPFTERIGLPSEILPLLIVKMFSSSAATGLVLDIFQTSGPDSYAGLLTSILMSCTETIFYTMSLYFLAAKVTRTRYTLAGALLSTLAGTVASVVLTRMMMG